MEFIMLYSKKGKEKVLRLAAKCPIYGSVGDPPWKVTLQKYKISISQQ